jgi:hypothetical protein
MALDPFAPVRFGIRLGIGVLRFELHLVERLLGLDREEPPVAEPFGEAEPLRVYPDPVVVAPEPVVEPDQPRVVDLEPEEPAHVDTEPELVAEFAEPGAEEGAGPEIHVDEPWAGYRKMRVADIRERVTVADPAELAVVQLYESANRGRASVLEAVERRSKELANLPG